jgi:hypothetical protein
MTTFYEVNQKIDSHVDICAVRYMGIEEQMRGVNARLKRIEGIMITFAGAMLILMINIIFKLNF